MCGIIGSTNPLHSRSDILNALDLLKHRGPDANGVIENKEHAILLGHTRLSIIDIDKRSNQPFSCDSGDYSIVFNGEIYNYKELKDQYLGNEKFDTESDTEVLLKLFVRYGKSFLNNLDGMFAFAIYDKKEKLLFCARDQLGIKPFYYCKKNKFVFASEIKALIKLTGDKPSVSHYALYEFMRNSFVYEPETGFEGIYKLGAGEFCTVDLSTGVVSEKERYWIPHNEGLNRKYSIHDSVDALKSIEQEIEQSISRQTRSDVPVGLFFSGGVDSTIILSQLRDSVTSFTVKNSKAGVEESGSSNDYDYAQEVALQFGLKLNELQFDENISGDRFLKSVRKLAVLSEELLADYTFCASMDLASSAKKNGYTVMLSGMGADEIFGGYTKYRLLLYPRLYCFFTQFAPLLRHIHSLAKKIDRFMEFCTGSNFADQYTGILGYFSKKSVRRSYLHFEDQFEKDYICKINDYTCDIADPFKKAMYLDIFGFMGHNFSVADKSSMQASQELRVPLASKRLFEYSFRTPTNQLIDLFHTKKPLRRMLKGIVSDKILTRKKAGFHPPMDLIIMSLGSDRIRTEYAENSLFLLVDESFVDNILNEHFNRRKNHTYKIFQLLYLCYWYNAYFLNGEFGSG